MLVAHVPGQLFAGSSAIKVGEVAARFGVTSQHILNLVEDGSLVGIDLRGRKSSVRCIRVPIECYRDFILERLSGDHQAGLIRQLPEPVRRQLHRELQESLRVA